MSGLAIAGLCSAQSDNDTWQSEYSAAELLRVASVLDGAELFRRMRLAPATTELTVTMPRGPSFLERELAASLGRPGGFISTSDAFTRIAQAATSRLVVMTPFIDPDGFRWLKRIFEACRPTCEKIVVLRDTQQYLVELGVLHSEWLRSLKVSVKDYHLSHGGSPSRSLAIETFHSKIVAADATLAYVGSANLLWSSEGVSLETGFLVDGQPAMQVARLVDGVLRVARSL
jgi:hypothetical protein